VIDWVAPAMLKARRSMLRADPTAKINCACILLACGLLVPTIPALANGAPLPTPSSSRTPELRSAITLCQGLDLVDHHFNSFIELPPVTGKISNDAHHA
jgi:hypothetical protein